MTFTNEKIDDLDNPVILGFSISNVHGLAISGANTITNDVTVPMPKVGEATTASFKFAVPPLVPGSYAISVTAVTLDEAGSTELIHTVTNAMMFQVSSPTKVFGLIGLNCEIEID